MENNTSYRVRTNIGDKVLNISLDSTCENVDVLSLRLKQSDVYKTYGGEYGIIVGRVVVNDGFGVPNAKVSVFIPVAGDADEQIKEIYPYATANDINDDGIRYNTLPNEKMSDCHQNVGTFPSKRYVLDNEDVIEVFDSYYKYTTVTNSAGDYMIFGVPVGNNTLHTDVDLSDIGMVSQRPTDMMYKGYNIEMFDSPSKFKSGTNLDGLAQIKSETSTVYVYPFCSDSQKGEAAITRHDVRLSYKIEPTAVFMGSLFSDTGSAVQKSCKSYNNLGRMNTVVGGSGKIEMIRKTYDNRIERFQIKGDALIDANGVWCYQIPMNLDYMTTDEFGNIVESQNPNVGIPTRACVRFRISFIDGNESAVNKSRIKHAAYLVPNMPNKETGECDFEFGKNTQEESFVNLFWNKIYTVKNYIPRYQTNSWVNTRQFLGIKMINEYGTNNPLPYNSLYFKQSFNFKMICVLTTFVINIVALVNRIVSAWDKMCYKLYKVKIAGWRPFKFMKDLMISCVTLSPFCVDAEGVCFAPNCGKEARTVTDCKYIIYSEDDTKKEMACFRNALAVENGVVSFDFYDDWLNGSLYAPQFWIKVKTKTRRKFLGLFGKNRKKTTVSFCGKNADYKGVRLVKGCSTPFYKGTIKPKNETYYKSKTTRSVNKGIIVKYEPIEQSDNDADTSVYYYNPGCKDGDVLYLLASNVVLLGSLDSCDVDSIPQLAQYLQSTSYNEVPNLVVNDIDPESDDDESDTAYPYGDGKDGNGIVETTGWDWGILGAGQGGDGRNGGLFVGIDCTKTKTTGKSCVNASRICELGVSLDETYHLIRGEKDYFIMADGYVGKDSIVDGEARQMFATMNSNNLKLGKIPDNYPFRRYEFKPFYPENFDGIMQYTMTKDFSYKSAARVKKYALKTIDNIPNARVGYVNSNNREIRDLDYVNFRLGSENQNGVYYNPREYTFPRFENSFYFYFGVKPGSTALDILHRDYFSECEIIKEDEFYVEVGVKNGIPRHYCNGFEDFPEVTFVVDNDAIMPLNFKISTPDGSILPREQFPVRQNSNGTYVVGDNSSNRKNWLNHDVGDYSVEITDAANRVVSATFGMGYIYDIDFTINASTITKSIKHDNLTTYVTSEDKSSDGWSKVNIRLGDFIEKRKCDKSNYKIKIERKDESNNLAVQNGYNEVSLEKVFVEDGNEVDLFFLDGEYTITISWGNETDTNDILSKTFVIEKYEEMDIIINGWDITSEQKGMIKDYRLNLFNFKNYLLNANYKDIWGGVNIGQKNVVEAYRFITAFAPISDYALNINIQKGLPPYVSGLFGAGKGVQQYSITSYPPIANWESWDTSLNQFSIEEDGKLNFYRKFIPNKDLDENTLKDYIDINDNGNINTMNIFVRVPYINTVHYENTNRNDYLKDFSPCAVSSLSLSDEYKIEDNIYVESHTSNNGSEIYAIYIDEKATSQLKMMDINDTIVNGDGEYALFVKDSNGEGASYPIDQKNNLSTFDGFQAEKEGNNGDINWMFRFGLIDRVFRAENLIVNTKIYYNAVNKKLSGDDEEEVIGSDSPWYNIYRTTPVPTKDYFYYGDENGYKNFGGYKLNGNVCFDFYGGLSPFYKVEDGENTSIFNNKNDYDGSPCRLNVFGGDVEENRLFESYNMADSTISIRADIIGGENGMDTCSSKLDPFAEFTVPTTPCLHFEDGWFGWRSWEKRYDFRCHLFLDGVTDRNLLRDNLYLFKSEDKGLRNAILNNENGIRNTVPNDKIREWAKVNGVFNHNDVNMEVLTMEEWIGIETIDDFLDSGNISEVDIPNIGERGLKLILDDRFESDYYYGFVYIDADTNVRSFSDVFYRAKEYNFIIYNAGENGQICEFRLAKSKGDPDAPYSWEYHSPGDYKDCDVIVFDNGFKLFSSEL